MLNRFAPYPFKPRRRSCGQVQQYLLAYSRNDMPAREMQLIEQHLSNCGHCSEQLVELQALEAKLYSEAARSYPALDPATEQRIHLHLIHTLHKGVLMARVNQGIRNMIRLGAVAGALLFVLAAVFYLRLLQMPGSPGSTPESSLIGSVPDEPADVITFGAYEASQPYYQRLIDQFNQQSSNIQVQFVPLTDERFNDSFTLASAADVVLVPFGLPSEAAAYFRDLQPLLDSDADFAPSDFWPGMLEACQDGEGRQVGVPVYASLWGVFYDRDAFLEAGLAYPGPGWTLDDFRQAAQSLANPGDQSTRYGLADNLHLSASILRPYIESYMVAASSENPGDLSSNLAQELKWYTDLAQSGAILPVGSQQGEWEALFTGNNPPAMWVGQLGHTMPGSSTAITPQQPLLGMAISQQGYAPYPARNGTESSNMTPVSPACVTISSGSRNLRHSWDLLAYLSQQEHIENQGFGHQLMRVPARQSVAVGSGFFNRLPKDQQDAVRYSLEHLWPGTRASHVLSVVNEAMLLALSGSAELEDALATRLTTLADAPPAPQETQELTVATPQPTSRPGQTSVRFFFLALSEGEKMALTTLGQAYNQTNSESSVRIQFTYDLPQDLDFTKGFSEQFDCYTWYSPGFFDPSETDYMLPLDPFIHTEPPTFAQDFYPEQLGLYRWDGQLYGLPATSQPAVIYYNADLLRKRGIPIPDPDWTYQEFLDMAYAATSQDPADPSYGFLFDEWESLFDTFHQVKWMDKQDLSQPRAYFDSSEVLNYLTWLSEMREADVLFVKYDNDFLPAWKAFQAGQIAFWTSPAGNPFTYYFADSMDTTYEIGVLPLPLLPGNEKYDSIPISRGYFISPRSDNPQICWDWIKFLTEQPNAMEGVPARSSITTSPAWTVLVGERQAEAYRLAVQQYDNILDYNHVGGGYYTWRHEALRAALSGTSLEPLLSRLQAKADRYLACMVEADASRMDYPDLVYTRERCTAEAES